MRRYDFPFHVPSYTRRRDPQEHDDQHLGQDKSPPPPPPPEASAHPEPDYGRDYSLAKTHASNHACRPNYRHAYASGYARGCFQGYNSKLEKRRRRRRGHSRNQSHGQTPRSSRPPTPPLSCSPSLQAASVDSASTVSSTSSRDPDSDASSLASSFASSFASSLGYTGHLSKACVHGYIQGYDIYWKRRHRRQSKSEGKAPSSSQQPPAQLPPTPPPSPPPPGTPPVRSSTSPSPPILVTSPTPPPTPPPVQPEAAPVSKPPSPPKPKPQHKSPSKQPTKPPAETPSSSKRKSKSPSRSKKPPPPSGSPSSSQPTPQSRSSSQQPAPPPTAPPPSSERASKSQSQSGSRPRSKKPPPPSESPSSSKPTSNTRSPSQKKPPPSTSGSPSSLELTPQPSHPSQEQPPAAAAAESQSSPKPTSLDEDIDTISAFIKKCIGRRCCECGSTLIPSTFTAAVFMKPWLKVKCNRWYVDLVYVAKCSKKQCQGELMCLGCGKEPPERDVESLPWCCEDGILFVIWVLLAWFDELEMMASGQTLQCVQRAGLGTASTKNAVGVGYGTDSISDMGVKRDAVRSLKEIQAWLLQILATMIPSTLDHLPQKLLAMLRLSLAIDKVGELLRYDCLEDVELLYCRYEDTLLFVHKLGRHSELLDLVTKERPHKWYTPGLEALNRTEIGAAGLCIDGTDKPVAQRLVQLVKKSKMTMALRLRLRLNPQVFFKLCDEICDNYPEADSFHVGVADPWATYHRKKCLTLTKAIRQTPFFDPRKANTMTYSHIERFAEIIDLSTSLPVGIFVKVSENHPDLMGCLIVGPVDTPYAYGLFEFDLVYLENYHYAPPMIRCTTAVQGIMNPNLNSNGTVRLPSLGTRPGHPAGKCQPGRSTILSILTSIQSMILGKDPYGDNPGYGAQDGFIEHKLPKNKLQAQAQLRTVQHAMLDWLEDPDLQEGLWADVVRKHFTINKEKVLATVQKWSENNEDLKRIDAVNRITEALSKFPVEWDSD